MMPANPVRSSQVSRPVRYAWFLLGGLVTLAVLMTAVVTIWQVAEGNFPSRQQEQSTISSEHIPDDVFITGTSANVELNGAETDALTADLNMVGYMSEPVVDSNRRGADQAVELYCRYNGVPVWFLPDCGIDYSAQVPYPTGASVELTSGSVFARGMEGDVQLRTTSGNIVVQEHLGSVDARTSSGSISLELSEAPVHVAAETDFGDILIGVSREDSYRIITDTDSDIIDVEVTSDPEADSTIDLRSIHGRITVMYFD